MKHVMLKTATEQDFFARGRRIAKAVDAGKRLPRETVISFEEPADLLRVLSSAVKRDVDELALAGLISVEEEVLLGHGRMKRVRAVGQRLTLPCQTEPPLRQD